MNTDEYKNPIPRFSFKSAIIIVLTAVFTSILIPSLLSTVGIDTRLSALILNSLFISMAVCYCQYFIETKKGFDSNIKIVYLGLSVTIGIITYFWLYIGLYM